MNVISTLTAATERGHAQPAPKQLAARDSGSPAFEDLLSRKQRDSSEGKDDADGRQTRRDGDRAETTDSSPQGTLRMLETQAQQILTVPLTLAFTASTSAAAVPGEAPADSATPGIIDPHTMPSCGEEGGGGSKKSSPPMQGAMGSSEKSSVNSPTAGASASPADNGTQAAKDTATLQANFGSSLQRPPAKSSTEASAAAQGDAPQMTDGMQAATETTPLQANFGSSLPRPPAKSSTEASAAAQGDAPQITDGTQAAKDTATLQANFGSSLPRPPAKSSTEASAAVQGDAAQMTDGMQAATETTPLQANFGSSLPRPPAKSSTEASAAVQGDAAQMTDGMQAATETTPLQANFGSSLPRPPAKSSAEASAAAQGDAAEKTISPLGKKEISAADADGTPVAKERRNMPEHPNEQPLKASANTAGGPSAADAADGTKLSSALEKSSAPRRIEPEQINQPASVASPAGATEFRSESAMPIAVEDPLSHAPSAESQAATHFVEHTMELAERVSVKGGNHVEVQMRLPDGKEVTVSLQLANGEWKPVFKTESSALCQALEQSWQQTAAQPSDRSVRFSAPVFESSQSQAGSSATGDRQPDAQGRNSARQEQADAASLLPFRNRPAVAAVNATHLTATGKIRLYA